MPRARGAEPSLLLPAALLVAAVAAAYATSLPASFQFDDWNVIVDEPRVRSLRAFWESMPGIRPVLKLTYALGHEAGLGVAGFRAVNVAIHAANACLVLVLATWLARRHGAGRAATGLGLLAASVFALHPVQTEAVTYVSGRSSSLCALFALGSLLAWIRGRAAWSAVLLVLALGTKETALLQDSSDTFGIKFVAAVTKALKKGGSAPLGEADKQAATDYLMTGLVAQADAIKAGMDVNDPADRALRGKLLKALAAACSADFLAHAKDAKKPDADKLATKLAKSHATLAKAVGKAFDKAAAQGVVYTGPDATAISDALTEFVDGFVDLTETGVPPGGEG